VSSVQLYVTLEVLTAVLLKIQTSLDVTLCYSKKKYFVFDYLALKKKEIRGFETPRTVTPMADRNIPEYVNRHSSAIKAPLSQTFSTAIFTQFVTSKCH
jgi:hypothetical protein